MNMCVDTQDPLHKKNLQNKAFMSVKKKLRMFLLPCFCRAFNFFSFYPICLSLMAMTKVVVLLRRACALENSDLFSNISAHGARNRRPSYPPVTGNKEKNSQI